MAVEIVASPGSRPARIDVRTTGKEFHDVPIDGMRLFSVNPGVSAYAALSVAWALDCCVQDALQRVIADGEMDANQAFLCKLALEAAQAIREACGSEDAMTRPAVD